MRPLNEREKALNMFYRDGKSFGMIAKETGLSENTIKSWVLRYRRKKGITSRGNFTQPISLESTNEQEICTDLDYQRRIIKLEMKVDLIENFLLETERRSIKK